MESEAEKAESDVDMVEINQESSEEENSLEEDESSDKVNFE